MRVLNLRILNLNSLAGDFTIDFTHPAFGGGVFAITGPTGAGKTTILDAVCLALYGRTPRLARIGQSANEIMSRGRGECAAEVTFETRAGRWRAAWAQRRSRLKPEGALQEPRHEIAEAGGRLLESQISKTGLRVTALTGLTFEQFTRSSLLAQGAFAAFLAAPADDKAALLEQITGTALYSDISILVHQRRAEERRKLEDLERAGESWAGRPPGEENAAGLKGKLADFKARLAELELETAAAETARAGLKTLAGLEEDRRRLGARAAAAAERRQNFAPLARRLELANRTLPLAPLQAQLNLLRQQRREVLLSFLRSPDGDPPTALAGLGREMEGLQARLEKALQGRGLSALRDEGRVVQRRLGELAALKRDRAEAARLERERVENEARLAQARAASAAAAAERRQAEGRLKELTAEDLKLAAALEAARRRRSLADWRGALEPGRPCPLCGALDHPWAYDQAPDGPPETAQTLRPTRLEEARRAAIEAAAREAGLAQSVRGLEETILKLKREERRRGRDWTDRAAALNPEAAQAPEKPNEDRLAEAERAAAELEGRLAEAETLTQMKDNLALKIKDFKTVLDRAADLEAQTARLKEVFQPALAAAGFDRERDFDQARLPEEERLKLEGQARELEAETAALAAAREDNADRLLAARSPNLAGLTLPAVETALAALAGTRRELLGASGALEHQLAELAQTTARRAAWHKELTARREEARRWETLHELIGSADGKKYRAFAQSLTFESLIGQANRQLAALSDRYLLIRHPAQGGLELSVADLWQAGEIRSTRNLSGGESFLVSLALALGLARLSGRQTRVDSLFLDEGFGALDEETLETVLNTLDSLNQDGRLVGVISHVPALRERLTTQIRVLTAGPHSRLSGPGVTSRI